MQGGWEAQGNAPAGSVDAQPADGEAPARAAAAAAGTQGAAAESPADPSPGRRSLRSPTTTPGSQRRRPGGRAASAAKPPAEVLEAPDPAPDPGAGRAQEAAAPRAAPPNFASALASFVSGQTQHDGAADDPGLGELVGGQGAGTGHRESLVNGWEEARAAPPPNVLADTTRPNLLAPAPPHGKAAARKGAAAVTWAPPPAGLPDTGPDEGGPILAGSRAPSDEEAAEVVPDSAVTAGGGGTLPSGGQVSLDGGHEEAGQGVPGAAGRTPHPAGRQVRTSRCLTGPPELSQVGATISTLHMVHIATFDPDVWDIKWEPQLPAKLQIQLQCVLCLAPATLAVIRAAEDVLAECGEQAGVRAHGGASVAAELFPDAVTGFRAADAAPDAAAATPQQGVAGGGAPGGETLRALVPLEPAPPRRRRPPPSQEEFARAARLQARPALGQAQMTP